MGCDVGAEGREQQLQTSHAHLVQLHPETLVSTAVYAEEGEAELLSSSYGVFSDRSQAGCHSDRRDSTLTSGWSMSPTSNVAGLSLMSEPVTCCSA